MGSEVTSEAGHDAWLDAWLICDDDADTHASGINLADAASWRILIVDDDVDVHVVTKFSLRNVTFMGRPLNFLHAYSGKEGLSIMRDTPDVALVLLDVVMETDDAGLILARQIRGELGNHLVRVVLRTGQSGQAMEQSVIVDYDINDYRTKSDLTTQKLFTTVISSLRSYDSLLAIDLSKKALQQSLAQTKKLQIALDQHCLVSVTDSEGKIVFANDKFCALAQYSLDQLQGENHRILKSGHQSQAFFESMWQSLKQGDTWKGEMENCAKDGSIYWLDTTIVPLANSIGEFYQYVAVSTDVTERKRMEQQLQDTEAQMAHLLNPAR